jgi:hypothetical protein
MPLFGARLEISERSQDECKRVKLLALNEWTIKLGLLFHTSIHRTVEGPTVNKSDESAPRGLVFVPRPVAALRALRIERMGSPR